MLKKKLDFKKRYPTDLTERQWQIIDLLIPPAKQGGRPREVNMREVINCIFYISRTGCQWKMIPKDFPPKSTVYEYYSSWTKDGTLDKMMGALREQVRIKEGREPDPTATIVDSQSVKTAGPAAETGYDGGKKIKGRKRHLTVDILGLPLIVKVLSAGIQDRAGAKIIIGKLKECFIKIKLAWADGGYDGKAFKKYIQDTFSIVWQVVRRPRKKFQVVKFRWIVERTFGWMNYFRRLSKDYEFWPESAESWIKIASIQLMVRRLSPT